MRSIPRAVAVVGALSACLAFGCGLEQVLTGGKKETSTAGTGDGGASDGDAGVSGLGCGIEPSSGVELCLATSVCPSVAVDHQALPHCGFRIRGGSTELVCGCGDFLCSMGTYTTCAQAAQLLTSQTESAVCQQVAEGRCIDTTPTSSGSSGSSGTCDQECYRSCGGGEGCAQMCGC
ncbi:MAG: hypothetical protein KF819_26985 [Labilithrix sp.]|nr:hypothetical protein [Labilithrix sp.]